VDLGAAVTFGASDRATKGDAMRVLARFSLVVLELFAIQNFALADDPPPTAVVSGHVTDFHRHPVAAAQARILDEKGEILQSVATDAKGSFQLKHKYCISCNLEVVPDEKTGLASALVENIPGNVSRTFLLCLQQGFRVVGRVVSEGHGMKGLEVRVIAQESDEDARRVHAGGFAKTARDGTFQMSLTPGAKKLSVFNTKYANLVSKYEQDFMVTADDQLPDIKLPSAH
jgi:hypothetical protein